MTYAPNKAPPGLLDGLLLPDDKGPWIDPRLERIDALSEANRLLAGKVERLTACVAILSRIHIDEGRGADTPLLDLAEHLALTEALTERDR